MWTRIIRRVRVRLLGLLATQLICPECEYEMSYRDMPNGRCASCVTRWLEREARV